MGKSSGLGAGLLVSGYVLSNDIGAVNDIGGGNSPLVVTGIDKSAIERIGGKRDARINLMAYFNDATDRAHPRFKPLPYTDQLVTFHLGSAIGGASVCQLSKQVNYDGTRGEDGSFTFAVNEQGNAYGQEWGEQLTAGLRTDTGATNGTSYDFGAASNFGLQAYLHAGAFVGTDVTVKLQESSDNGAGDPFADVVGGAFTQITSGPTFERIATAGNLTVERYLRVVTVTTGGFSSLPFHLTVVRNAVTPAF